MQWIKKSVDIDPASHKNSEWIHVRILETKLKGKDFITSDFLLNTDFGLESNPVTKLSAEELQKLSDALYYQLNERVSFVEPKDKVVAQLLFDLGNVAFLLGNYYDALADYEQAKTYGFTGKLMEQRITEADKLANRSIQESKTTNEMIPKTKAQNSILTYGLWVLGAALLTTLIVIIYRRRKKSNS